MHGQRSSGSDKTVLKVLSRPLTFGRLQSRIPPANSGLAGRESLLALSTGTLHAGTFASRFRFICEAEGAASAAAEDVSKQPTRRKCNTCNAPAILKMAIVERVAWSHLLVVLSQ